MSPPPESCVACRRTADMSVNGARLCQDCARLVDAHGGGEEGLAVLMQLGPLLAAEVNQPGEG